MQPSAHVNQDMLTKRCQPSDHGNSRSPRDSERSSISHEIGFNIYRHLENLLAGYPQASEEIVHTLTATDVRICRRLDASKPFDLNQIEKIAKILAVEIEKILLPTEPLDKDGRS